MIELRTGYFLVRLVRGGPWVPAEIRAAGGDFELDIPGRGIVWRGDKARFDSEIEDRTLDGTSLTHPVLRTLFWGRAIEASEFEYQKARRLWAIEHAPDLPEAQAGVPIDFNTLAPPSF